MVFQFYALYPHLTVRDNIGFPLRAAGLSPKDISERVNTVAERMDLTRLLRAYPTQLSGGDQQKVSLARAIVRRPAVYLMDEPLGTLDADQRLAMRELIRTEQLRTKVTTIYVTHDQEEAMSLADRIVVMEQGQIRQLGTPAEVYDRPSHLFVAKFVGSPGMNLIPCRSSGAGAELQFVTEPGGVPLQLPVSVARGSLVTASPTLGIRCEHIHEQPDGPIAGRVRAEEYLGSARILHVDTAWGRLVVRTDAARSGSVGSDVRFGFDPTQVSVFDGTTDARL
jgi:ABC-type sugar transport system ATPase subunit